MLRQRRSLEHLSDLAALRADGPIVQLRLPIIGHVHFVTHHAAASALLKDSERFQMRDTRGNVTGLQWWMPSALQNLADNMLSSDDPEHRRLRQAVDDAFARRPVQGMAASIERQADALLAAIPKGEAVDLVPTYAAALPVAVIADLIGLREDTRTIFFDAARRLDGVTGMISFLAMMGPLKRAQTALAREIEVIRTGQGVPGILKGLVEGQGESGLTDREIIAMAFLLLVAGHATTKNLISLSIDELLNRPEELSKLRANPDRWPLAVEEFLRYCAPVQMTKPRKVHAAGEFFGTELQVGDTLMAHIAAANRDLALFDAPDDLRLDRKPNPHLGFGTGVHFCLGFQLARLEARIALQKLFERFAKIERAGEPKLLSSMGQNGLVSLPVTLA
ncbi:MAG: cytochrome P450 [Pseudomonadota bacterium]